MKHFYATKINKNEFLFGMLDDQQFNSFFGFHEDSIWDFPEKNGVRTFVHEGRMVYHSTNIQKLTTHFEQVMS